MARKKLENNFILPKQSKFESLFDFETEARKYYNILFELYATTFKWENLPEEITRDGGELYLEKVLCSEGKCLFFYDDILKEYLVHSFVGTGINFYNMPTNYEVQAENGYYGKFTRENAVAIYNSPYFTSEINTINSYATKLALCDLVALVNTKNQATPYIIKCGEGQRLTLTNALKQIYEFNSAIMVDDTFDENAIKIYPLNAPFVADAVYDLKTRYWQESLNFVGVGSGAQKKERVSVSEQMDSEGEKTAMLETRKVSRDMAAEQINKMFGLNISVSVRKDLAALQKLRDNQTLGIQDDDEIFVEEGNQNG